MVAQTMKTFILATQCRPVKIGVGTVATYSYLNELGYFLD